MKKTIVILWLMTGYACKQQQRQDTAGMPRDREQTGIQNVTVISTDTALHIINGVYFFHRQLYNGFIETCYASGNLKSRQSFYQGREEGWQNTYYENGAKNSHRFYHKGEKDGTHTGWWPDGRPRFEYHFKNGVYEGDFKEWYAGGKPVKHIIYRHGKEQSGTGWRENGKVYMSFVVKDGRWYGLINPNLCYSLKKERTS